MDAEIVNVTGLPVELAYVKLHGECPVNETSIVVGVPSQVIGVPLNAAVGRSLTVTIAELLISVD